MGEVPIRNNVWVLGLSHEMYSEDPDDVEDAIFGFHILIFILICLAILALLMCGVIDIFRSFHCTTAIAVVLNN